MGDTIDLFADALKDMANGPRVSDFQGLTEGLLRRLSEKGLTLAQCADRKMLDRSLRTLEGHCVTYGIRFPDFTPANMRTHIQFIPSGDFLNLTGEHVGAVAKALGVVVMDGPMCSVPVHGWDEAKVELRRAGFEATKAKPAKKRRGKPHA